ncbi:unnamed protein product [Psylliodes chrysocephalus]|uniref:Uncharacterized protein n=1 Tax=Psylliodes chrysocephalus TaxID=3402493 RepID=A0A9P0CV53_9CUCU|nr:unnamed protein product [Psylliodes chrysocephala]
METHLAREVCTRFTDIRPVIKSGIQSVQQVKKTTEMMGENGTTKEISNFLWVVPLEANHKVEEMYKRMEEVKGKIPEGERNINLMIQEQLDDRYARKCTEAIFHKTVTQITVWNNKPQNKEPADLKTEKIILKTEGKDYASALRSIRETVNLERIGVKVKNIRKTAQGDVMLEVLGGKEKAQAFKGAIEKENDGSKVEIRRDTSTIYISDIEADITEEDIRQVIIGNCRKIEGEIQIKMRENRNGNQNAMITIDRDAARNILRRETLKIGWMSCRKRKVLDTSLDAVDPYKQRESTEVYTLNEAIERNRTLIEKLNKIVKEVPNTHKNLKETIVQISKNAKEFERASVVRWLEEHKFEPIEKITYDMESQTLTTTKKTAEAATQTEPWHGNTQTLRTLAGIDNLEKFRSIENHTWGQEVYQSTRITVGNPLSTSDNTTKVVLLEPGDPEMTNSIQRLYRDKFPELVNISKDFEVIEQITKIKSNTCEPELSSKKIIKIKHDGTTEDIWNKLTMLREETLHDEQVAIHHINNISIETLRKMTETVFQSCDKKVTIYTTASQNETEKVRSTYGMIVSEGGKSYKGILGKVKSIVGTNQSAKYIRGLRSTKDGKLLLTLGKDSMALKIYMMP